MSITETKKSENIIDKVSTFKTSITNVINNNDSHILTITSQPGFGCHNMLWSMCKENDWKAFDPRTIYDENAIYDEMFKTAIESAEQDPDKKYILILDDINRYNNDMANAILNMLLTLENNDNIPSNLYVIIKVCYMEGYIESMAETNLEDIVIKALEKHGIYDYDKCFEQTP